MGTGSGKWTVEDGKSDGRKELGIWKAVAERWIFRNDGMNPSGVTEGGQRGAVAPGRSR